MYIKEEDRFGEAVSPERVQQIVRARRRRVYLRRIPPRQFGEYGFGEPTHERTLLTSRPPHLSFLTLDNFVHGKSSLTPALVDQVRFLAGAVDASWNSAKPIVEIRLVGHTDSTGPEKFNVGLGDRRAQSVQAQLLKIPAVARRVLVVTDPSPGEAKPTATNATPKGRGQNRRVEVFVIFRVKPAPPPPPPPCIDPRKCLKPPSEEPPPPEYFKPIPGGRQGRSLEEWLNEVLSRLPKPMAWVIRKAVITGACMALERSLGGVVGGLSEAEKEQLRKECEAQAKKPR